MPPSTRRPKGSGGAHWSESRQRWIAKIGRQSRSFRETRKQRTDHAPAAVNRWLAEEAARLARGEPPPSAQPLKHYLHEWIETIVRPHRSTSTYLDYRRTLRRHIIPALGDVPLGALTRAQVQAHLTALSAHLAPATVRTVRAALVVALNHAVRDELLPRNVAALTETAPSRRAPRLALDVTQARALLAATAGERLGAVFVVAITAGLRRGELLGLRWQDVDLERGRLTVTQQHQYRTGAGWQAEPPKAGSSGVIPLLPLTVAVLAAHRDRQAADRARAAAWRRPWVEHGLVFPGRYGQPLSESAYRLAWRRLLVAAGLTGLGLRPHDLRHVYATLLAALGADLPTQMALLRHRSPSMTLHYSHSLAAAQQAAVARLEAALHDRPADRPAAAADASDSPVQSGD